MATVILHIDDSPELPDGLAETLAREGYRILHTADPEEAVRLVEEHRPALVLMEIELAACDGLDLMAGIRDPALGAVPVLVLTRAARGSGLHGEAIALGAVDFVSKPARAAELCASIREVAPPAPKVEERRTSGEAAAELSGSLSDAPMPELLARLRRRGATGVLVARRGQTRVGVQLRNGSPVAVASSRQRRPHEEEKRGLSEEDALLEMSMRAEAALFESFGWTDGTYGFHEELQLEPEDALDLGRDPASLVLIGVLDVSPLEQVRSRLRMREALYASSVEETDWSLEGLELTPAQEKVLAELEGSDTLAFLLESKVFEERMLYGLWVAGRIELHATPTITLTELLGGGEPVGDGNVGAGTHDPAEAGREALREQLQELFQRVMIQDDFEALDIPLFATDSQVRTAYEQCLQQIPQEAFRAGPELSERATRIRERIESAYQNLKDEETRRAYSLLRKEEEQDRDARPSAERALEGERWFRKGSGMLKRKRYDEAAEAFGMASHLDPSEGEYLAHLGYALFLSRPSEKVVQREAIEHVANGIKRSPKRELSYVYLGRILKAQGDTEAARKVFRRAVRIRPDCHAALQELRILEMRDRKGKGVLSRLLKR